MIIPDSFFETWRVGNIYLIRILIHSIDVSQGLEALNAAKLSTNHVESFGWICFIASGFLIKKFLREHLPHCLSYPSGIAVDNGTEVIVLPKTSSLVVDWDTMSPNSWQSSLNTAMT